MTSPAQTGRRVIATLELPVALGVLCSFGEALERAYGKRVVFSGLGDEGTRLVFELLDEEGKTA